LITIKNSKIYSEKERKKERKQGSIYTEKESKDQSTLGKKKIKQVLKVLTPVKSRRQVPSQFIGDLLDLWKLKIISQELLPKDFQSFEILQILADQLMPGDENFNKTLLANHNMSKRVVQWQLSVSFWYAPNSKQKQINDRFFY